MKQLLRVSKPEPQESIFSFLLRLTRINNYPSTYWIYDNIGLIKKEAKIIFPKHEALQKLHILTGISIKELNKLTYFSDLNIKEDKKMEFSLVYHYAIDGKNSKICPLCFKENPYQRKVWDFKTVIACPIHNCVLIDECNHCHKKISHFRREIGKCNCGNSLTNLPIIKAENHELMYSSFIYQILGCNNTLEYNLENVKFPIGNLKLYQILFLSISLLNRLYYAKEKKFLRLAGISYDNCLREILKYIHGIFINWPNGFYEYLEEYKNHVPKTKNKGGISNNFNQLYLYLYNVVIVDEYNFLRNEFENYLKDYWEDGSLNGGNKHLKLISSKYMSSKSVYKKYGVTKKFLNMLITNKKVRGKTVDKGDYRLSISVIEEDLKNYLSYMEKFITKNQTVQLLGVNMKNINLLISEGILLEDAFLFRLKKGCISKSSINTFLKNICCHCKEITSTSEVNLIDTDNTLMFLNPKSLNIVDLYKMIIGGLLTPYIGEGKRSGFRDYYYNCQQLEESIDKYLEHYCGLWSPKMIKNYHNISESEVTFYIKEGFLKSENRGRNFFIKNEDLILFKSTYLTMSEILKIINISNKKIHRYLKENGVYPVTNRDSDGKGAYLYLKKDINKLVLFSDKY